MTEDHDLRAACAKDFAEIKAEIKGVEKLAVAVEKLEESHQRDHLEQLRMMSNYHAESRELAAALSERTALNEQKAARAHERLDTLDKTIRGVVVAIVLMILGIGAEKLFGG